MINKSTFATLAIAGALLSGTGTAFAGDIQHNSADLNGDGKVTENELVSFVKSQFANLENNSAAMVLHSDSARYSWAAEI